MPKIPRSNTISWLATCLACLALAPTVAAEVVVLTPVRDATLYQDDAGAVANGAGQHLFIARTAVGDRRRAVLAFDVAGAIPAGATIVAASLTLNVSNTRPGVNPIGTEIHRLLADWGEGASDAPGQEGVPANAADGDATWIHTFFPGELWGREGGDYDPLARATTVVGDLGPVTWDSTPEMVADVQDWLDSPLDNYGWILVGDGFAVQTAKRLDSREHPDPDRWPQLTVEFQQQQPVIEIPTLSGWGLILMVTLLLVAGLRRLA